jgi:hypothetical protein
VYGDSDSLKGEGGVSWESSWRSDWETKADKVQSRDSTGLMRRESLNRDRRDTLLLMLLMLCCRGDEEDVCVSVCTGVCARDGVCVCCGVGAFVAVVCVVCLFCEAIAAVTTEAKLVVVVAVVVAVVPEGRGDFRTVSGEVEVVLEVAAAKTRVTSAPAWSAGRKRRCNLTQRIGDELMRSQSLAIELV